MDKLNKMSTPNISKHLKNTIDSHFVICDGVKTSNGTISSLDSISCDVASMFLQYIIFLHTHIHTYIHLYCVYKVTFYTKIGYFLKCLNNTTFEANMSYCQGYNIQIIKHFYVRPNVSY